MDDILDFDFRWDQALIAASKIPKENVLESWYKLKKHKILFSFRQPWLITTEKLIEIEQCQAVKD